MIHSSLPVLEVVVVVVLWAAATVRIPTAIRSSQSFIWWLAILLEASSMTIAQPSVGRTVDQLTGISHMESLLKHLLFVGFEAMIFYSVTVVIGRNSVQGRRILWVYTGLTTLAMTVLFCYGKEAATSLFLPERTGLSPILLYWLIYLTYAACVSTVAFVLFWRFKRKANSTVLRVSLVFLAVGFAAGLVYAILRTLLLFVPTTALIDTLRLTMYVGLLSFAAGSCLSAIPDYSKLVWSYRSGRNLYPLWKALISATPEVTLSRSRRILGELSFRSLDFRLYRRVIEIRDGLIALRTYTAQDLPAQARRFAAHRNVPLEELDHTVIACALEVARRAKMRGELPPGQIKINPYRTNEANLFEEVNFLCDLASAHQNPIVKRFAESYERNRPLASATELM
jgi:hypothetical protein